MALSRAFAESKKMNKPEFKYQQLKKNGEWGAIRTEKLTFYKTPEQAIKEWNKLNPDTKFRLVED